MLLLKNTFIKKMEKTETFAFDPNLKQGTCALYLSSPVALYNISYCKLNASIMSIFILLHRFYLQKLTTNDLCMC